mgnify:CR=1 FL=1
MNPQKLFDYRQNTVKGVFHKYRTPKGTIRRLDLCLNDQARFKDFPLNRKKRCRCKIYHEDLSECPTVMEYLLVLHNDFEDRLRKETLEIEYNKHKKTEMLNTAVSKYLAECRVLLKKNTVIIYKRSLIVFQEWMPNQPLTSIEWLDKDDFIVFLKSKRHRHQKGYGFTNQTITSLLANVSSFFVWCFNKRLIEKELKWVGRKFRYTKPEQVPYTEDLINELEDYFRFRISNPFGANQKLMISSIQSSQHILRSIVMARNTAMRIGEIWSLPLCNITKTDILIRDQDELNWSIKDHENRDIEINDDLGRFLTDEDVRSENERWFLDNGHGYNRYVDPYSVSTSLKRILVRDFNRNDIRPFHAIRSYAITKMLESGMSTTSVRDICGHSSSRTTEGYLPTRLKHHQSAVSALNRNQSSIKVDTQILI